VKKSKIFKVLTKYLPKEPVGSFFDFNHSNDDLCKIKKDEDIVKL